MASLLYFMENKIYCVNLDVGSFTDSLTMFSLKEFASTMNALRKIYGRIGYLLKSIVRKTSDQMVVYYDIAFDRMEV